MLDPYKTFGGDGAETEGIEDGYRAGAHGEDVAEDSADACGCALKWLDVAGMIVGFDFEGSYQAVANVDYAGVFSWALHD